MPEPLLLAAALDGAGWHPAAWRAGSARPTELLSARYWLDLVATAERGLLDLVTIEDALALQSSRRWEVDERVDQVRGRLDAVLIASRVAPVTSHIGLVPTTVVTHTEPFHLASAISTLDHVSDGRAGWRPRVSALPAEAALVNVRPVPRHDKSTPAAERQAVTDDLFEEAADVVEVVRRLWDSWEDDAIVRDVATGRFVDREKLHYVDFAGRHFTVKGPSIVPRPPQGQPVVAALAHAEVPWRFAAGSCDVVFVTPVDEDGAATLVRNIREAEAHAGRTGPPLCVVADLIVFLAPTSAAAAVAKARLDELDGAPLLSDAAVFTGTPVELADLLEAWQARGVQGFRLRPGVVTDDLPAIVDAVVPELQARGRFRRAYEPGSLRHRLGLSRPDSRYAAGRTGP